MGVAWSVYQVMSVIRINGHSHRVDRLHDRNPTSRSGPRTGLRGGLGLVREFLSVRVSSTR